MTTLLQSCLFLLVLSNFLLLATRRVPGMTWLTALQGLLLAALLLSLDHALLAAAVLLIKSMDQLNTTLLLSLDIMTCLENQGVQIWSPGRGRYDTKKMSIDYDVDRFLNDLEERRYAREIRESYFGDCEPEDYDSDDGIVEDNYGDEYHPEEWEKGTVKYAVRW